LASSLKVIMTTESIMEVPECTELGIVSRQECRSKKPGCGGRCERSHV
jgi:hypothetical protein